MLNRQSDDAARALRALHAGDRVLVLPNVWDALSAALFASSGARAIATTSAGVAWACGYPDGDVLPRTDLLFALSAIVRSAGGLPVTADIERGYSDDPDDVAALALDLHALGVAGVNLEDGDGRPAVLAAKIAAVKSAVRQSGRDLFVNARTDVYLGELAEGEEAVRETIARAQTYARAGADAIFVPALATEAIARVADAIVLPLAVFAVPGLPRADRLYELGVRRLSAGPGLAKLAYGVARRAAEAFARDGDGAHLASDASLDFGATNALMGERSAKPGS
ncbi:MAG TPA: isocitrate lyase/phosphoenolpyruvate mutase family protein [Candidatus Tumulicola sp.]|nr:isocitrate lyase/phosphoenolpyruvate mutase family protein [Candidatus Tumulicola sp.]